LNQDNLTILLIFEHCVISGCVEFVLLLDYTINYILLLIKKKKILIHIFSIIYIVLK